MIESPGTEESPAGNSTIIIYLAPLSTESSEPKRHYFLLVAEMMKDVNAKIQLQLSALFGIRISTHAKSLNYSP